jgi:hypothetical protein
MPVATQRLAEHEDVARAEAFVFRVVPQWLTRTRRQRLASSKQITGKRGV